MILRCTIDGLLLDAEVSSDQSDLIVYEGEEAFLLEALEALYYEVVQATEREWLAIERKHYRLLRRASDFAFGE
jgi:hypothetical protein